MALRWVSRRLQLIQFWTVTVAFTVLVLIASSPDIDVPTGALGIFTASVAVLSIGFTVYHRSRPVPSSRNFDRDVWNRTARRGVLAAAATTSVISLLGILPPLIYGISMDPWLTSILCLNIVVFSTQFIVQGWHYEHARRLFRRHIENNARARTALEEMALNPHTVTGAPTAFGPL